MWLSIIMFLKPADGTLRIQTAHTQVRERFDQNTQVCSKTFYMKLLNYLSGGHQQ